MALTIASPLSKSVIFSLRRSSETSVIVPVYSMSPVTSSATDGALFAIPTNPELRIRIASVAPSLPT